MPKTSKRAVHAPAALVLLVRGHSERPVCHFELESSTYLQRRPADMLGPSGQLGALDPNVHVVEMVSLGTQVRNTKRFYVINPQNVSYDFTFEPEGVPNSAFRCQSSGGIMLSGKRSEMVFEFTPDTVGLSEAFYRFKLPRDCGRGGRTKQKQEDTAVT